MQPFRYAGYYYDDETGLYYLQSRYYSPILGRFLTKDDPSFIKYESPQTLNLYSYCGNNPVNFNDPTGQFVPEDFDEDGNFIYGSDVYASIAYCGGQYTFAKENNDKAGMDYWHSVADYFRGIGPNPDAITEVSIWDSPVFIAVSMVDGVGEAKIVGGKIIGYTKHGLAQAIGRDGVGVSVDGILNAVRNPSKIVEQTGGRLKYIGENATVVVNKYGRIITTWASNHLGLRK